MGNSGMHSNLNFPALLSMAGVGAAWGGTLIAAALLIVSGITHQRKMARITFRVLLAGVIIYSLLFLGFSLFSHETVLAQGEEKYFCEVDCHLAYSVLAVKAQTGPSATRYVITLRTRFDETTTAQWRPKDVPLRPAPRTVVLVDARGNRYAPQSISGTPLMTQLVPAESYATELLFDVPAEARDLRLLVSTTSGFPDHMAIGDENSWLHKKTYFAI